jgi:hypothetical protein
MQQFSEIAAKLKQIQSRMATQELEPYEEQARLDIIEHCFAIVQEHLPEVGLEIVCYGSCNKPNVTKRKARF